MPESIPAINERIKAIIQHYSNGVVSAFAHVLDDISQQKLNRLFNIDSRTGKYPIATTDILVAITEKFVMINPAWLLTGNGEMLLPSEHWNADGTPTPAPTSGFTLASEPESAYIAPPTFNKTAPATAPATTVLVPQIITVDKQGNENILHVNARAAAGYLKGYGDREYLGRLQSFSLPGLNDGTYRSFEVEGDSMHPTLRSGQMVIGKWVEKLDFIRDDRVYIVVHKTRGIIIKRLLNRINQRNVIVAKSDATNDRELYRNFDIAPDEIQELWYAVFHGGFDFMPPSDMWKRLNNVEADLTAVMGLLKANNLLPDTSNS